ncbi:hypothetical protein H6F96_15790 [Microcoleus sp. FACHB-53]|nr:hypothetical protein [Microcoleus sp. FACHB-53]
MWKALSQLRSRSAAAIAELSPVYLSGTTSLNERQRRSHLPTGFDHTPSVWRSMLQVFH